MGREFGRFLEQRRAELGLTRRDVADQSGVGYSYVCQLEAGDREPGLKAMRQLAPVLDVPVEQLAGLVAAGEWTSATAMALPMSTSPLRSSIASSSSWPESKSSRDRTMLSVERRLRDVPPLERIALLNELIAAAVQELGELNSDGKPPQ